MAVEILRRRIKTTQDLRDIVSNMKMLSSVSILQYEQADKSLDKYLRNLRDAFHILALHHYLPQVSDKKNKNSRYLFLLIGSDNGMVGRFNREIVENAQNYIRQKHISLNDALFITIGKRMNALAENSHLKVYCSYAVSNSVKAVAMLAENVILNIDEVIRKERISDVIVVSHHRGEHNVINVELKQIIPFDMKRLQKLQNKKWETNNIPQIGVDAGKMFAELVNESLMIRVGKEINSSLAAEHYTRMTNMQNAEKNIDENLEELNLEYQQQRQEEITDELIDVISGVEAMKDR
ncbi:MAG: F0F1 ATP synthase subunit gamma [Alphaproteobacteria bacterium]|nr:F0F1 ATP synthase subunit gamma [Alphaproteobacteria bacterium]